MEHLIAAEHLVDAHKQLEALSEPRATASG
jgi:hypothetical protein